MCVVIGCFCGYAIWHYAVFDVYFRKSDPKPLSFSNFDEITRVVAISLGGLCGFVVKEILSRIVSKSPAFPVDVSRSS